MAGGESFGKWVKRCRTAHGWTQQDLAKRVDCSKSMVYQIEVGKRRPSEKFAEHLAKILEILPEERALFLQKARQPFKAPIVGTSSHSAGAGSRLPVPLTTLIGREDDAKAVRKALCNRHVRLLTLVGPPGIGKTRLAIAAATQLQDTFPDGMFFLALETITDPGLVASAIAQAVGIQETSDTPLLVRLQAYLRDRTLLLLLDGFEHLLEAAPLIADLLMAAPGLKVLSTSRAVLHLSGEQVFPVLPLAVPDLRDCSDLSRLAQTGAVALFIARAQAAYPAFCLTESSATAVAAICTHLDGLPLAIELAAARSALLEPTALLERLTPRLPLLSKRTHDVPLRHQTLTAAIDWSYHLLTAAEQALFARLAIFVGGSAVAAVEQICATETMNAHGVLDGLQALLDSSLVYTSAERDGIVCVRTLETIREYALERLDEGGERHIYQARHAAFYLALAEEAEPYLTSPARAGWLERLGREYGNLQTALSWALTDAGDLELGLRLAGALGWFWYFRGDWSAGSHWLEQLLAHRDARGQTPGLAKACLSAGMMTGLQGAYPTARRWLEQSMAIWQALIQVCPAEDAAKRAMQQRQAFAQCAFGLVLLYQGDFAGARMHLEESVACLRALNNPWLLAFVLHVRAHIPKVLHDYVAAEAAFAESAAVWSVVGDHWGLALVRTYEGETARLHGDYAKATALLRQGLELAQKVGDKRTIAWALGSLGAVAYAVGDLIEAQHRLEESLSLTQEVGDRRVDAWWRAFLGRVLLQQGDDQRAAAMFTESLMQFRDLAIWDGLAYVLEGCALLALTHGEAVHAGRLLGATERLRAERHVPRAPCDRAVYAKALEALRTQLDASAVATVWADGQHRSPEQAITEAADGLGRQRANQVSA